MTYGLTKIQKGVRSALLFKIHDWLLGSSKNPKKGERR